MDIRDVIANTPNGQKFDTLRLLSDANRLKKVANSLAVQIGVEPDYIVGLGATGLPIGSIIALETNSGFVPLRKYGKYPRSEGQFQSSSGNRRNQLCLTKDTFSSEDCVAIVDDWIESGEQMKSAVSLINQQAGEVHSIGVLGFDAEFDVDVFSCPVYSIDTNTHL